MLCLALIAGTFALSPLDFGRARLEASLEPGRAVEIRVDRARPRESFSIRRQGDGWTVTGGDENGAMYGALELAERARAGRLPEEGVDGQPYLAERGLNLFLTLPWDYELNRPDYAVASLNDPQRWWFHNEDYWTTLLDQMAEARLNWLDIHGTYDIGVTSFPNLYAYFIQSEQFPLVGVPPEVKAANLAQLNHIIDLAHARGIKVSLMAYEAKIKVPHNPNPPYPDDEPTAYAYTREVVEKLLRQVPGLDSIGFRIGESGRSAQFFNCYLEAIANSGRQIPLIVRTWLTWKAEVVPIARQSSDCTLEIKYNGEQWGQPYPLVGGRTVAWHSYAFEDYLNYSGSQGARLWPGHADPSGLAWPSQPYKIAWQVRANGTHRIFPFYSPDWVRRSILAMRIGTTSGFTIEPINAYYPASPRYYQAHGSSAYVDWIHQRDRMYLMLWGRLGYDPATSDGVFDAELEEDYGEAAEAAATAWKRASLIVPYLFQGAGLGPDHRHHAPELEWGGNTTELIETQPFDAHATLSVLDWFGLRHTGGIDGRESNMAVAQDLEDLNKLIETPLKELESHYASNPSPRLKELIVAIRMLTYLGAYSAARLDSAFYCAAVAAGLDGGGRHLASYDEAVRAWTALSQSPASEYYRPFTDMLRMITHTYHWRNQLPLVQAERSAVAARIGQSGGSLPPPGRASPPPTATLAWSHENGTIKCRIPAQGLSRAWLLAKLLPSTVPFHRAPMQRVGEFFETSFPHDRAGHAIAAVVEFGGRFAQIPDWRRDTPYLLIPSREVPTPYFHTPSGVLHTLDTSQIRPDRHSKLVIGSDAAAFFLSYSPSVQRKILEPVSRGMTLIILDQDYSRYPITWLPEPPGIEHGNWGFFDPGGALGLTPVFAPGIIRGRILPSSGWQVFGNGGIARRAHGSGEIWLIQARLRLCQFNASAAQNLRRVLALGGTGLPLVLVDGATDWWRLMGSFYPEFLNAHSIPFVTAIELEASS